MDRPSIVTAMQRAAERAAELILAADAAGAQVQIKPDGSPVTAADLAADALIVAELSAAFPMIPVISEESPASHESSPAGPFFLVDPIDGTKEFIAGRDEYTVNIALIEDAEPVLGIIVAPAKHMSLWTAADGTLWEGQAGASAPFAGRPSATAGLVAAVSRSHADAGAQAYLADKPISQSVVCGSSLKFCLVARGEVDLYPFFGARHEWDIAAGDCLVRASGGSVVSVTGLPLRYGQPGFRTGASIARSQRAIAQGY